MYEEEKKEPAKEVSTPKKALTKAFRAIYDVLETLVIAGAIVVFVYLFIASPHEVLGRSMEENFWNGEYLLADKVSYLFREPERGDVIVFIFPGERDQVEPDEFQYYLKRCVAVAGDTLKIINDSLYVNSAKYSLAENGFYDDNMPIYAYEVKKTFPKGRGYTRENYGPIRIPKKGDIINLNARNFQEWEIFIKREGHNAELRESIEVAIYREIGARDLYRRFSEVIENQEGAKKFAQLSEDEDGHRIKLESWFEQLVGERFSARDEKIEESEIRGVELGDQAGALEALNLAIDAAARARDFYAEQAENTDIPELEKLFTDLSEEEAGHFNLLEAERNSIIGGFYWFDLDSASFLED